MKGAEIILRLAVEGSPCEEQHNVRPRSRALEYGVFVVDSNRVGDEGEFHFFGRSQIVATDGSVLAWTNDQENIVFASLDKSLIQRARKQNPYLLERRPEIYSELLKTN